MTFYRGYDKAIGADSDTSFIWVSDNKDYAEMYGNSLATMNIDENCLKLAFCDDLEKIADELNYDIIDVLYTPCEIFINRVKSRGYNAFTVEDYDYRCLCLLDKSLMQNLI